MQSPLLARPSAPKADPTSAADSLVQTNKPVAFPVPVITNTATNVLSTTVTLNGLLGIAFGWLYQRYGLEAAMVSHFSADIVLHVLAAI